MSTATEVEAQKRAAAEAALAELASGMVVGLGTGSTARYVVEGLAARLEDGRLQDVVACPTSEATASLAGRLGVPLRSLAQVERVDLAVDGADEVTAGLELVKGMGGALVRERLVAARAARFIVVADEQKAVDRLGTRSALPLAVIPFGAASVMSEVITAGCQAELRHDLAGQPVVSDDGLWLVDVRFESGLDSPYGAEKWLRSLAGVVDTGLFLGMAATAYLSGPGGVRRLDRA